MSAVRTGVRAYMEATPLARYNVQLKCHKKFQTLSHSVSLLPVYKNKINTWRNNTTVAGKMSDP